MITDKNGNVTYVGLVVGLYQNHHDLGYDTSYHAYVWNWDTMKPDSICYADTRATDNSTAQIDTGSPAHMAYQIYLKIKQFDLETDRLERDSLIPKQGQLVRVAKGTKVKRDTIAMLVKVYQNDPYNRCIIQEQNGTRHETYVKNLEPVATEWNPNMRRVKPSFSEILKLVK